MADSFKKSIIVLQKKSQPSPASSSVHQIEDTSLIQDEKRLMEDEDNTMKEIRCKSNLPIEIHAAMSTETSFHLPGTDSRNRSSCLLINYCRSLVSSRTKTVLKIILVCLEQNHASIC
nr:uncharacterized protein LOC117688881 isoform X1 [Crassostrea gigas]